MGFGFGFGFGFLFLFPNPNPHPNPNQDYLDSMEGATRSGLMVADEIIARADALKVRLGAKRQGQPQG